MVGSIEWQVISCIMHSDDKEKVKALLSYDESYYDTFEPQIKFIREHYKKYHKVPDDATFLTHFNDLDSEEDIHFFIVNEPLEYLTEGLISNKKRIMLVQAFNKCKDLGEMDAAEAWEYVNMQYKQVCLLDSSHLTDMVSDAKERAETVKSYSKQARIPTGFEPIDKAMYGGLSTVEELVILIARTNSGKSWVCTKMAESAQSHGFPVLYYSPEMQASYLGTRFDTWRGHYSNSQLFKGQYTDDYLKYIDELEKDNTPAFVLENKDAPNNSVTVPYIESLVEKHGIKLVIIDGLAYMDDKRSKKNDNDYNKYKNICEDLFDMSKQYGCAVVVVTQANRATKESKDDKGNPFPNLYNVEGSDHPARICTQAFAIRQIFEEHILDIRLEKSRNAQNQKPTFSFKWDIDTGDLDFIANPDDLPTVSTPVVNSGFTAPDISGLNTTATVADIDLDIDDNVEF